MDRIEAKILISNLLGRVKKIDAEQYELPGVLTTSELTAISIALAVLGGEASGTSTPPPPKLPTIPTNSLSAAAPPSIALNLSIFELPQPSLKERLCLDFGTAMSKAALVISGIDEGDSEEVHVLELGKPGDQREVSDTMLISSIYIDNSGLIWFGKKALDRSLVEGSNGERMRIDNVKRFLSEGAMQTDVSAIYNPTQTKLKMGDLLLAYLMFMTWAANSDAAKYGAPRNIKRRFAMPCFSVEQSREIEGTLRTLLGQAQILADTFGDSLHQGLRVEDFEDATKQLHSVARQYDFVTESLTEPLGVANAILSTDSNTRRLTLIVDVGAGTSDVSLYRLQVNSDKGIRQALEAKGAARGIPLAGNHLDRALTELILRKAGVGLDNPRNVNIRSNLALNIRDYKETLFISETLTVRLLDGQVVDIEINEFIELAAVQTFRNELRQCLVDMLETVDESWVGVASREGLAVILTGGGSKLAIVQELTSGQIEVKGKTINLLSTAAFPDWLEREYPALEEDFPRIAVSLGGGRESLIHRQVAKITAGDILTAPTLDRF